MLIDSLGQDCSLRVGRPPECTETDFKASFFPRLMPFVTGPLQSWRAAVLQVSGASLLQLLIHMNGSLTELCKPPTTSWWGSIHLNQAETCMTAALRTGFGHPWLRFHRLIDHFNSGYFCWWWLRCCCQSFVTSQILVSSSYSDVEASKESLSGVNTSKASKEESPHTVCVCPR